MIRLPKVLFIAATAIAIPGVALAQDPEPPADPSADPSATPADPSSDPAAGDPAPAAATGVSLTLGKGKVLIAGSTGNINLSDGVEGEPISIAPSIWYGVSDKLQIGLTHDGGTTPLTPRPAFRTVTVAVPGGPAITASAGAGICLTGEDSGCPEVYDNVGADALFVLANDGKFAIAAHPGVDVLAFDPFVLGIRLGFLGRYAAHEKVSIVFDPRVKIGATERDAGNKETLDVPVWLWFAVNPKFSAYAHIGLNAPFDGFDEAYSIPVGVGFSIPVNEKFSAGADFHFTNLIGKNGDADGRALGIRLAYAL